VTLSPGTSVGPYRIVGPLGSGGMGEVYRAQDTRLGRLIALKVLHDGAADDPIRLRRFEQEARAASALNHPNIVALYDVGDSHLPGREQPLRYLAMEYLDGDTLESLVRRGPLPVRRCLEVAVAMADGLARAHESGIIHRDLKPSNVIVTRDGHVKILDFGLAKLRAHPADAGGPREETLTSPGFVMGTIGYMAPEQAAGEGTTEASDQFSFGCLLYEMLTGRRAFERSSPASTLSAILRDDPPPLQETAPGAPDPLRWVVERCLAKSPRDRYAATRDLARDLLTIKEHLTLATGRPLPAWRRRGLGWRTAGVAAVAVLAAAWAGWLVGRGTIGPEPRFRRLTFRHGVVSRALFAPNSNAILYTASWEGQPARTYLMLPDASGPERSLDAEPQLPMAYSDDGSEVLVLLGTSRPRTIVAGTLAWWPALGGKPRRVLEGAGWADWAKRGRFFVGVRDTGAQRVLELRDEAGTVRRELFQTGGGLSFPRISPDERHVAFFHHTSLLGRSGEVQVVAIDGSGGEVLSPRYDQCLGLDWHPRTNEVWYSASPTTLSSSTLWAARRGKKPRVVYALPDSFILQSLSADGERCLLVSNADRISMTVRQAGSPPRDLSWLRWTFVADLSPDGRSVLFFDTGASAKTAGLWTRPLEGGDAGRVSDGETGRFSPDGRLVVSTMGEPPQLVLTPLGGGNRQTLTAGEARHSAPAFAGPTTVLFVRSEKDKSSVFRIETDGTGARSLGAEGCDLPAADAKGERFLCVGGERNGTLFVHPMDGGPGRTVYELPRGGRFRYARWSTKGDVIYAVTADREFLTLHVGSGKVRSRETLPVPGTESYDTLFSASFNGDATVQAYSVARFSAGLYLGEGLR
jgi:predicted Ser/Thr protein kinase